MVSVWLICRHGSPLSSLNCSDEVCAFLLSGRCVQHVQHSAKEGQKAQVQKDCSRFRDTFKIQTGSVVQGHG